MELTTQQTTMPDANAKYQLFGKARNAFWMAPMSGISEVCFRQIMDEAGAGVVVSELISAKGLVYNSEPTRKMVRIHPNPEALIGIQVFGESAEDIITAAKFIEESQPAFLDINLGCPVKKVVKKGCGAALLRDPGNLYKYLSTIKNAINLPLTVKMRTGWNDEELTIHECVKAATDAGCEWVAIHGRTRAQGYEGLANWDLIAEVKNRASIPIIGNGDIRSAKKALSLLNETGVDAVMIGRGALRNPLIFQECLGVNACHPSLERMQILRRFHDVLQETYDLRRVLLMLRKFAVWMASGYPGAAGFRGSIFKMTSARETMDLAEEFFEKLAELPNPTFEESEAFMMGGDG
ncbi:MAG: tRNA dihydrouridine synthase DusB [Nitrospinales bacterium]